VEVKLNELELIN